jgi:hypothetical protein
MFLVSINRSSFTYEGCSFAFKFLFRVQVLIFLSWRSEFTLVSGAGLLDFPPVVASFILGALYGAHAKAGLVEKC